MLSVRRLKVRAAIDDGDLCATVVFFAKSHFHFARIAKRIRFFELTANFRVQTPRFYRFTGRFAPHL